MRCTVELKNGPEDKLFTRQDLDKKGTAAAVWLPAPNAVLSGSGAFDDQKVGIGVGGPDLLCRLVLG